ncbi:putative ribose-Phosphate pyrophosphokinase (rppk) (phosphoribosylpyrophosphate synthetase) (p-rib-pp synthetase) (prpp synthetase) [Treponema primitia ZAS-2]|uniref:Putative ribose-Phosphate pyrophosphokinase (Rppk) (Phosphoribosylpyrophosphate synthetase) (P-rib-pp synthetase) (Prpp synthetase) n=1 Tax=Treponema primitia (strain ATCC BAA-887 / DSM 12427 / ZAS-2) TaxID=545694 RepID=F5YMU7_TREPZ|nr:ribose-phosphate diphosphokinase [Treponema primitia]AEF86315.1 putative ribose-Phosphate pyrophosphokinase (rppk) (phosphoribosylpyrophosphate synthetase) (p-rib-pp synthetase) (prpp synthetase) [Treponema primitia ZAS-2]
MVNEFVIAATRSMKKYAAKVVEDLAKFPSFASHADSINGVQALKTDLFADGEMEVSVKESLRGRDVVLFTNCARNEAGIGVEEAKIELYHTIDALKRSQAERIIVFEPFVSCSRSDRTTRRSSVGLWVHFKMLATLGTNHIITYQLHSDKSRSMLDPTICLIDDMPALTLLKKYLCDNYIRDLQTLQGEVRNNWAFCSVDAGGEKLGRQFANAFMAPLVVAHKQRDYSKSNTIESINILSAEPIAGKVLWIVDDMVDTAGSVVSLIRALTPFKPAEINIISTHAVFSPPAGERLSALFEEGLLKHIIVTDTVYKGQEKIPNLEVVPSTSLSAKVISTIITDSSLSKLMDPFNAEAYFKAPYLFNQS